MKNPPLKAKATSRWQALKRSVALGVMATTLAVPLAARAEDKAEGNDARIEGYPSTPALTDPSGSVPTWMFWALLTSLAVGVLFMNSKRTHLD